MSNTLSERQQQISVTQRATQMDGEAFASEIQKHIASLNRLAETVAVEVNEGNMSPYQGYNVLACTSGALFGYEEFHPRGGVPTWPEVQKINALGGSDSPSSKR